MNNFKLYSLSANNLNVLFIVINPHVIPGTSETISKPYPTGLKPCFF